MKNQETAIDFPGAMRLHVALDVADLERSIAFYSTLFATRPSKLRPGYAKFEPAEPPVNLTLNAGRGHRLEGSAHLGLQVRSVAAVAAATERLRAAGLAVRVEEATECCYAVQDKVWVEDPDGNPWEVFVVTQADSPRRAPADAACCVPAPHAEDAACCEPARDTTAASGACCGGD